MGVACSTLQFNIPKETVMKLLLLTLCSLLSVGLAQDTYHCPDGWLLQEDTSGCRCFYFSAAEMVTRNDADALCAFHNGAWVAEMDSPGINYWLKSQLLDLTHPGEFAQFWLGAFTEGRHNENNPGEWWWPHKNETVQWFDWGEGEPSNLGVEGCLAMMEYHDAEDPLTRDYFWNDFVCDETAHYICENVCDVA